MILGVTHFPCGGCPDRHTLCWSDCPKYQQAKAENDAANEQRYEEAKINWIIKSRTRRYGK